MADLYVSDTVLYVRNGMDTGHVHTKTREQLRLTDGVKHEVTVRKLDCSTCVWSAPDTCRQCPNNEKD